MAETTPALRQYKPSSSGNSYSLEDGHYFVSVQFVMGSWSWTIYERGHAVTGARDFNAMLEDCCRDALGSLAVLRRR